MPADSSLIQVLSRLEGEGFDAQFAAAPESKIRCTRGGHTFAASAARLDQSRRLEGVSDPDDMLMVFAMHCPICDAAGTLVLPYGPETGIDDADVLAALDPPPSARTGAPSGTE